MISPVHQYQHRSYSQDVKGIIAHHDSLEAVHTSALPISRDVIVSVDELDVGIPNDGVWGSRSLGGSGWADGCDSDWVFNFFTEGDSGTEGDGSPFLKRARTLSRPTEAAEYRPRPAVAVKGVQMPGIAYADRSPRGDQEYKVHQVVSESGSGYEITAFTEMWLPKALMDLKLFVLSREQRRWLERAGLWLPLITLTVWKPWMDLLQDLIALTTSTSGFSATQIQMKLPCVPLISRCGCVQATGNL